MKVIKSNHRKIKVRGFFFLIFISLIFFSLVDNFLFVYIITTPARVDIIYTCHNFVLNFIMVNVPVTHVQVLLNVCHVRHSCFSFGCV